MQRSVTAFLILVGLVFVGFCTVQPGFANDRGDHGWQWENPKILSGRHDDKQFIASPSVRIEAEVAEDVFAAGREIVAWNARLKDLFAAAGSLRLAETQTQDMIAAAGEMTIGGRIAEDLIAASGQMLILPGTVIGGDAVVAAGDLDLAGAITGSLHAAAGRITLSGEIGGDAFVASRALRLLPGTRIAGTLTYASEFEPEISENAVIVGGLKRIGPPPKAGQQDEMWRRHGWGGAWGGKWAGVIGRGIFLAGLLVFAGVLLALAPATAERVRLAGQDHPWGALGLGFALLVAVPVAIMLAMMSVVGLPLAFALAGLYLTFLASAIVAVGIWLGLSVAERRGRGAAGWLRRFLWTALFLLILVAATFVPVLGGLVMAVALVVGFGLLTIGAWREGRA